MLVRLLARCFAPTRTLSHADRANFRAAIAFNRRTLLAIVAISALALALGLGSFYLLAVQVHKSLWDSYDGIGDIATDIAEGDAGDYRSAMLIAGATTVLTLLVGIIALACARFRLALQRRAECPRCRHGLNGLPLDAAQRVQCPECATYAFAIAPWNEVSHVNGRDLFAPAQRLTSPILTRRRVTRVAIATAVIALSAGVWWGAREVRLRTQASTARADAASLRQQHQTLLGAVPPQAAPPDSIWTAVTDIAASRDASLAAAQTAARAAHPQMPSLILHESVIWAQEVDEKGEPISAEDALAKRIMRQWLESSRTAPWYARLDTLADLDATPIWYDELAQGEIPMVAIFGATRHLKNLNEARIRTASRAQPDDLVGAVRSNLALAEATDRYGITIGRLVSNAYRHATIDAVLAARSLDWPADVLARLQTTYEDCPPRSFSHITASEGLWIQAGIADHFSDIARVKRGMRDSAITGSDDLALIRSLWMEADPHTANQRLGSYIENVKAAKAMLADMTARVAMTSQNRSADNHAVPSLEKELALVEPLRSTLAFALRESVAAQALHELCITALALERCRVTRGSYPPTLDALVPDFLSAVPLDPYNADPLRYRLDPSGDYFLWSIGPNMIDDGGSTASGLSKHAAHVTEGHDMLVLSPLRSQAATPIP